MEYLVEHPWLWVLVSITIIIAGLVYIRRDIKNNSWGAVADQSEYSGKVFYLIFFAILWPFAIIVGILFATFFVGYLVIKFITWLITPRDLKDNFWHKSNYNEDYGGEEEYE